MSAASLNSVVSHRPRSDGPLILLIALFTLSHTHHRLYPAGRMSANARRYRPLTLPSGLRTVVGAKLGTPHSSRFAACHASLSYAPSPHNAVGVHAERMGSAGPHLVWPIASGRLVIDAASE